MNGPLILRFFDWQCGHHQQRPADIEVASPQQALAILRAMSHAISQPGHFRAMLFDDSHGIDNLYVTDDYVGNEKQLERPRREHWLLRPVVLFGYPHEIAVVRQVCKDETWEAFMMDETDFWLRSAEPWDGDSPLEDQAVVTTKYAVDVEAKYQATLEDHRCDASLPPVYKSLQDVLVQYAAYCYRGTLDQQARPAEEAAAAAVGTGGQQS